MGLSRISAPLARGNLHLVVLHQKGKTQPLILLIQLLILHPLDALAYILPAQVFCVKLVYRLQTF